MLYNYIIFRGDPSYVFIFLQSKRPEEIGDFLLQNMEKPSDYTVAKALTSDGSVKSFTMAVYEETNLSRPLERRF